MGGCIFPRLLKPVPSFAVKQMNWDDLRVAIAVQQSGSFLAAAGRLKIDETTVSRRVARLEETLGFKLFEAADGVRRPTQLGAEALRHAVQMLREADRISGLGADSEQQVTTFRLAATDSVAVEILAAALPCFLKQQPGLRLELLASTENVNFSRWEADFAIRLQKPDKGDFIISKIGVWRFYFFTPAALDGNDGEPLLCAYPDSLDSSPESRFLIESGQKANARCTSKNLLVIKKMITSGSASGILPSFMCADLLEDPRFRVTELPITREVWLLSQPHLKQDPQARSVIDWIKGSFSAADGSLP